MDPVALVAVAVAGVAVGAAVSTSVASARQRSRSARLVAEAARRGVHPDDLAVDGRLGDPGLAAVRSALTLADERQRDAVVVRRRLEHALDCLPGGVLVADATGAVVFRNAIAGEFHEARHGEALVEAAVGELLALAAAGDPGERTLDLFGPPRRTIVVAAAPLTGGDGDPLGAVAWVDDVTERRRLEDVRRDFVANISHELKSPVGALSLLAETLLSETDAEVAQRLAERMVLEASRVADTIDDLLVLSRIEASADEQAPTHPVDVDEVVAEAIDRLRPAAERRGITIGVGGVEPALRIQGDRRQVVSALYNLLDNAAKYSDEGSVVEVATAMGEGSVDLMVTDTGIGIPAKDVERVFERFYRVDHARSRQTGGTGLGLAIVRHVAVNHGGEVLVESRLGEGSTFTLRLPAAGAAMLAAPEEAWPVSAGDLPAPGDEVRSA
jgi:two-component system sensor histidine kinase SenX3